MRKVGLLASPYFCFSLSVLGFPQDESERRQSEWCAAMSNYLLIESGVPGHSSPGRKRWRHDIDASGPRSPQGQREGNAEPPRPHAPLGTLRRRRRRRGLLLWVTPCPGTRTSHSGPRLRLTSVGDQLPRGLSRWLSGTTVVVRKRLDFLSFIYLLVYLFLIQRQEQKTKGRGDGWSNVIGLATHKERCGVGLEFTDAPIHMSRFVHTNTR